MWIYVYMFEKYWNKYIENMAYNPANHADGGKKKPFMMY